MPGTVPPIDRGFGNAKGLGQKIAKAMQNTTFQGKKNARAADAGQAKSAVNLPHGGRGGKGITSASVIPSHRYRRYFGIRAPGTF